MKRDMHTHLDSLSLLLVVLVLEVLLKALLAGDVEELQARGGRGGGSTLETRLVLLYVRLHNAPHLKVRGCIEAP